MIVAMSGASIVRVMCRTCKKERGYRPPAGAKDPTATPVKRRATKEVIAEETVSVETAWHNQMVALKDAPRVVYAISAKLTEGAVVKHPTFGDGIVMKLHFPNKAEIIFRDTIRTLIHSKV